MKEESGVPIKMMIGFLTILTLVTIWWAQQEPSFWLLFLTPFSMMAVYLILFLEPFSRSNFGARRSVKEKVMSVMALLLWIIFLFLSYIVVLVSIPVPLALAPFASVGILILIGFITVLRIEPMVALLIQQPPLPPHD